MAKENVNLCPEHNEYVGGDARKIMYEQQEFTNFERTPILDAKLRWVCPPQENFAVRMNIAGVGERISKRIWLAGFNAEGDIESVRSISVASLRSMALGFLEDGQEAPKIRATTKSDGSIRTIPGTIFIHAMEDVSFIKGINNLYVIENAVAIKPTGSAEVYKPLFVDGKMQAEYGFVKLTTCNMKFFELLDAPTEEEVAEAAKAIKASVDDQFYAR